MAQAAGQLLTPQPIRALAGAAVPGELDFGEVEGTVLAPARAAAATALSPVAGVFRGLGACLGGIFRIITKPLALIGVLIFAALWYFLAAHGETVGEIVGEDGVRVLSFLTFAEGGADRELPGAVLGALGRGTVAAGVLSLFGGLGKLFRGIGALFTGRGEKRGVLSVLLGVVLGALFYFAFAGADASASTAMVGLSGAALSLEALGGGSGKLYDLAQSLTSKKRDGVRTAVPGRCDGLLTGLALGSLLAAAAAALLL